MSRHVYLFAAMGALCFLPACFGGGSGPQPAEEDESAGDQPRKSKAREQQAEPAAATAQTGSEYSYNPIGKRDPFRSFTSIEVVRPDRIVASELQNWELDQLRLVAILWGIDEPVAMVEDPKGKGHIIAHGDLIGKKWGRVTQIKSDEVVVTEEFRDPIENRPITNEYSMKLPDPHAETQ
jgi:type IV pilus assembly protein PilP